jgi:hypothetical protein
MRAKTLGAAFAAVAVAGFAAAPPTFAATVTPSGTFAGNGVDTISTPFGSVTCAAHLEGTIQEDGTAIFTLISLSSCADSTGTACTAVWTSLPINFRLIPGSVGTTAGSDGTYSFLSAPESFSRRGPSCLIQCTFEITAAGVGGTVDVGDTPTLTMSAGVTSNDGFLCTAATWFLTFTITLVNTGAGGTGITSKGTGNDLTLTA